MNLQRLRGRIPLVAFVLLAAMCLLLVGVACACLSDHPAKEVERALGIGAGMPGLVEMWSPAALAAVLGGLLLVLPAARARATGRASPAELQRFLI